MKTVLLLMAAYFSVPIGAGSWQGLNVDTSLDTRYFNIDSPTSDKGVSVSGTATLQNQWQSEARAHSVNLKVLGRWDDVDQGRRDWDVRRLWYNWKRGPLAVGVGVQQEFWGVTESRHLVNILNQIDAVADVDEEDLMGQPMLKMQHTLPGGHLAVYAMPYFRERPMHEYDERLALPVRVNPDPSYESGAKRQHLDVAARYSVQRDALDFTLSYFHGTNREPRLLPHASAWREHYEQVEQYAADAQWTVGPWLLKAEVIRRSDGMETFGAHVFGFEYSYFQALGRADVSLVLERLSDRRSSPGSPTPYQDDWFAAMRVAWNDVSDSTLLLGSYFDRQSSEKIWRLEYERRLGQLWSLDVAITVFDEAHPQSATYPVRRDGFASLRLTRHFSRHAY